MNSTSIDAEATSSRRWTAEQERVLREGIQQGHSNQRISRDISLLDHISGPIKISKSANAIVQKIARDRIPDRRHHRSDRIPYTVSNDDTSITTGERDINSTEIDSEIALDSTENSELEDENTEDTTNVENDPNPDNVGSISEDPRDPDTILEENIYNRMLLYMDEVMEKPKWRKPIKRVKLNPSQVNIINNIFGKYVEDHQLDENHLWRINDLIYCIAIATTEYICVPHKANEEHKQWNQDHMKVMCLLRKHLSWARIAIKSKQTGNNNKKMKKSLREKLNIIKNKYDIDPESAAGLISRKIQENKRMFKIRQRKFMSYKTHQRTGKNITGTKRLPVTIEANNIRNYWNGIVGQQPAFIESVDLQEWSMSDSIRGIKEPTHNQVLANITGWTEQVMKKAKNWKAPGPDGIQAFWLKKIKGFQIIIKSYIFKILEGDQPDPWLCEGRVVCIPKKEQANSPEQYRPITCTNTCYKIITGVMCKAIESHCIQEKIVPKEQRAIKRGSWATTEAHLVDNTIRDMIKHKTLKTTKLAWFDYKKAYDSLIHSYLIYVLLKIKIPWRIIRLIKILMSQWTVKYIGKDNTLSDPLRITNGVLQGDTMSPYLFCIGLIPITYIINKYNTPITVGEIGDEINISHQFYMDDLIVYYKQRVEQDIIEVVERASRYAGLHLNKDKCAILGRDQVENGEIPRIGILDTYKYLGIDVSESTRQDITIDRAYEHVKEKIKEILSDSSISSKQIVEMYNSTVIPKMNYIFLNAISGTGKLSTDIKRAKDVDILLIKHLRGNQLLQQSSNRKRLFLKHEDGGLGFRSMEEEFVLCVLRKYIYISYHKEYKGLFTRLDNMTKRGKRTPIKDYKQIIEMYGIDEVIISRGHHILTTGCISKTIKKAMKHLKLRLQSQMDSKRKEQWENNPSAGAIRNIRLNIPKSFAYLKCHINIRSVFNAFSIQENAIITNGHPGANGPPRCRMCHKDIESIQHIMVLCPKTRVTLMVKRHDEICLHVLNAMRKYIGTRAIHYNETIDKYTKINEWEIFYNTNITNAVTHNKPDIIFKSKNAVFIIEVGVAWPNVINERLKWKSFKYTVNSNKSYEEYTAGDTGNGNNLITELSTQWKVGKIIFVPIVIGPCGELTNRAVRRLNLLPIDETTRDKLIIRMQKAVILNSDLMLRAHMANPRDN